MAKTYLTTDENGVEKKDVFIIPLTSLINTFASGLPYYAIPTADGNAYRFSDNFIPKFIKAVETSYLWGLSREERDLTLEYKAWVNEGKPESDQTEHLVALEVAKTRVENGETANADFEQMVLIDVTGEFNGCG
jgi:hypothetical protein